MCSKRIYFFRNVPKYHPLKGYGNLSTTKFELITIEAERVKNCVILVVHKSLCKSSALQIILTHSQPCSSIQNKHLSVATTTGGPLLLKSSYRSPFFLRDAIFFTKDISTIHSPWLLPSPSTQSLPQQGSRPLAFKCL